MKHIIQLHKSGLVDYKEAWDLQKELFLENFEIKTGKREGETSNHLFLLEHSHVYTLGKSGDKNNLLLSDKLLKLKKASFYKIDRGGDITYHGPGQLVGYPVFDLDTLNFSIKDFVFNIEEMLIQVVAHYGIFASRLAGATGVWLDAHHPQKARKIAAIGMKISKKVSMHGFALNVNTNLDYFNHIIPCGLQDKGVTSLQKELNREVSMEEVTEVLITKFEEIFGISFSCL
jgi:lipoyl(octanoyl) transferase